MGQLERYGLYVLVVVIFLILGVAIWGDEPQTPSNGEPVAIHDGPGALRAPDDTRDPSERLSGFFGDSMADPDVFVDVPRNEPREAREAGNRALPGDGDIGTVADADLGDSADVGTVSPVPGRTEVRAEPASAGAQRTYVVVRGDSFARISRKVFGSERHTHEIMEFNGITDANSLRPDQVLRLPDVGSATAPRDATPVASGGGGKTYTVVLGDNPTWISRKVFGTETHAQAIMDLNGITDARRLQAGMVLRLPDPGQVESPASVATNDGRSYTVVSGDSPARISRKLFGTEAYAVRLMEANGIQDPRRLRVGQVLRIPDLNRDGE
jgi:nucleoid-associated protein YgaU